jgi:hypothetical protein
MCHKCDAERKYLVEIEDTAVECDRRDQLPQLIYAICLEETDQDIEKHLNFLAIDLSTENIALEDTLIGRVYLDTLAIKARLQ